MGLRQQFYYKTFQSQMKKITSRKNHDESELAGTSISLIEEEVEKKLINPEESSYCNCNICQQKYELKEIGKTFLKQTNSSMKVQPHRMQEFFSLISSVNPKQYLKMDIPEICFFYKGHPTKLFRSNNVGVHKVDLNSSVKKNLLNIFLENKRMTPSLKPNDSSMKNFLNKGNPDAHIKFFNSVVPSYKHGELPDEKNAKNFIFHANSKMDEDPNVHLHRAMDEQICLIKYKDKGYQLVTQKQLRAILKSLLALQNVEFIQSYIKPSDQGDQIFQANYDIFKRDQNPLMISRSLVQVKIDVNLINKFSKDYIQPQHLDKYETQVLMDIPQEYCMYQTYKMVHYMELMKDMKVEKLSTLWLMESSGEICFFGLIEFRWRQNGKFSVDIGEIQQLKQLVNSQLSDFENELLNAWENMKTRKQRHLEKSEVIDEDKEKQIEQIRKESDIRHEKEFNQKRTRRKSICESYIKNRP